MEPEQIFGLICIVLALLSNGYKYEYMRTLTEKYKIFPWQDSGFETNTSKTWIFWHLTSSILLAIGIVIFMFLVAFTCNI